MAEPLFLPFPIRSDKFSCQVRIERHLAHVQTPFQVIDIYDTECFGKMLFLDGHIQLAELDEHAYHEALVHIPALSIAGLHSALVVGGGDGGVLRELCRHRTIDRIDIVEIDQAVISTSLELLPGLSAGAFSDPRVNLIVGDAFDFVRSSTSSYDLIVLDATDTYEEAEGELSEQLWTSDFYQDCINRLSDKGFVVTQADNLVFCPYSLNAILRVFSAVFPACGFYQALVPSFGGFSGYAWASNGSRPQESMPAHDLALRYLNDVTWKLAFTSLGFDVESEG
ncbi:MAG: Polyamine aminopropyltransferase [Fimbriimonadaceae bacterium]|nr:Polyamine aminopropyltransferase [Fimbriimonadaceae bacterium]